MRVARTVSLTDEQHATLSALARGRSVEARLVERSRIVLLAAEGKSDSEIAVLLSIPRQKAARWRGRFLELGLDGLKQDAPRSGRPRIITAEKILSVVSQTTQTRPARATHWSTRSMAQETGLSEASVRRIWKQNGLKPHRVESFKLSNDPKFAEKLEDIVGLYLNPPEHALVFSLDEKSQIQALDRTQPGLPLKKGRCQTMTHDYKRHGTTTLFAALNVANGQVLGTCMKKHRHQEWLRFLRALERAIPADKQVHLIVDNYATHKHKEVKRWIAKRKRFHVHFTPTSASWLNMVERFFRDITTHRLRRDAFRSVPELNAAIDDYIRLHNDNPKPFIWTAKANDILEKVKRGRASLDKLQSA
jgi:transposase